jgi:hypothetical protein
VNDAVRHGLEDVFVSYWEWFKLSATAVLMSSGMTSAGITLWWITRGRPAPKGNNSLATINLCWLMTRDTFFLVLSVLDSHCVGRPSLCVGRVKAALVGGPLS